MNLKNKLYYPPDMLVRPPAKLFLASGILDLELPFALFPAFDKFTLAIESTKEFIPAPLELGRMEDLRDEFRLERWTMAGLSDKREPLTRVALDTGKLVESLRT
jgi:hypothetical protein